MSHLESGFCVTDIEALALTVKDQCPDLELVRQNKYRTWATDHGRLAGDYPLPGIYQLKLMAVLKRAGHDVHALAAEQGVKLPANLLDLEKQSWTQEMQYKLFKNKIIKAAYDKLSAEVIGNDAEFVIRYKDRTKHKDAYEVGVVPHPTRKGEYMMMCDFYCNGMGLLDAKGMGKHKRVAGKDTWGGELKQAYATRAAERAIIGQIQAGNPEYGSYTKTVLPDGRIKIEVQPRSI